LYLEPFLQEEGLAAEEKPLELTACREKIGSLYSLPTCSFDWQSPSGEEYRHVSAGKNLGKENGHSLPDDDAYRHRVDQVGMKTNLPGTTLHRCSSNHLPHLFEFDGKPVWF
jgi:hypothetical protein